MRPVPRRIGTCGSPALQTLLQLRQTLDCQRPHLTPVASSLQLARVSHQREPQVDAQDSFLPAAILRV